MCHFLRTSLVSLTTAWWGDSVLMPRSSAFFIRWRVAEGLVVRRRGTWEGVGTRNLGILQQTEFANVMPFSTNVINFKEHLLPPTTLHPLLTFAGQSSIEGAVEVRMWCHIRYYHTFSVGTQGFGFLNLDSLYFSCQRFSLVPMRSWPIGSSGLRSSKPLSCDWMAR